MKKTLGFSIIIVVIGIGMFVLGNAVDITNYPPQNERIVAFGDSLVAGQGAPEGRGFVGQLETLVGREVTNLGVGGDTTADGVVRMPEVLELDPGIVILLLGGNDTLRRIPLAETEANLRTLIERFQKGGSIIVLLGVRGGLLQDAKADLFESLSKEYGTVYVPDVLSGILLKPELMSDAIHPNEAGYALIAERVADALIEHKLIPD